MRASWLAAAALALVLLSLLLVILWMWLALLRALEAPPEVAAAPPPLAVSPPPPPRAPEPQAVAAGGTDAVPEPQERRSAAASPEGEPEVAIVDEDEFDAPYVPQEIPYEGPTGMELFPPPGTKPLRVGIVVPDDFELPEGFVRHHQVTDDGEELPPVLAFHPDYEFTDDQGRPVDTRDRIVPPELAPPGLPIELLELPSQEPEE